MGAALFFSFGGALARAGALPPPTPTSTPTPAANTPTPTPTSTRVADVSIVKVASVPNASAGQSFDYTVTVTNQGPAQILQSIVSDPLPSQVVFLSCVPSGFGSPTCSGPPVGTNGTVNANLGPVSPGSTASLTISVRLTSSSGAFSNTAAVSFSGIDPVPANNTSTAVVNAGPVASAPVPAVSRTVLAGMAVLLVLAGTGIVFRRS